MKLLFSAYTSEVRIVTFVFLVHFVKKLKKFAVILIPNASINLHLSIYMKMA